MPYSAGLIVGMTDIIPKAWAFSTNFTFSRHIIFLRSFQKEVLYQTDLFVAS